MGTNNWVKYTSEILDSLCRDNLHQIHSINDLWDVVMKQELHEWRLKICSIPSDSDTGGRLHFYRCLQEEPAPAPCIYSSISTNRRQIIPGHQKPHSAIRLANYVTMGLLVMKSPS